MRDDCVERLYFLIMNLEESVTIRKFRLYVVAENGYDAEIIASEVLRKKYGNYRCEASFKRLVALSPYRFQKETEAILITNEVKSEAAILKEERS